VFGNNKYSPNLLMHKRLTVEAQVIRGHFMEGSSTSTSNFQATSPNLDAAHNASLKKRAGDVCGSTFSTTKYYLITEYSIIRLFGRYLIPWDLEHRIPGNFGDHFNLAIGRFEVN